MNQEFDPWEGRDVYDAPPPLRFEPLCFRYADLRDADFRNANLSHADFSYANVERANFSGAILSGARFTYAKTAGAIFSGSNSLINSSSLE